MSGFTSYEAIGIVARRRLNLPPSESLRFQPLVDQALLSLSRRVARRDDYAELRKEIAVTSTSGVITVSDTSILLEMVDKTGILILNGIEVKWFERYDDLRTTMPTDIYYAALRNRKIYVKDITTGSLGATNQSGTLDANYTPTLTELPQIYDEELLGEVIKLASGRSESTALSIQAEDKPDVQIGTG